MNRARSLIGELEPGVYSVRETATDSSHILDVREYHMELFPGKTSTLTVENQKRPNLIVATDRALFYGRQFLTISVMKIREQGPSVSNHERRPATGPGDTLPL